jgi:hypothetical protein
MMGPCGQGRFSLRYVVGQHDAIEMGPPGAQVAQERLEII